MPLIYMEFHFLFFDLSIENASPIIDYLLIAHHLPLVDSRAYFDYKTLTIFTMNRNNLP